MSDEGIKVVKLSGEVDIMRAPAMRHELLRTAGNRDFGLVVDLSEATYLDSAGVNVLFELAESLDRRQLQLAIVVPEGGLVDRVVSLVSLGSVAPVHRSVDAAVAQIQP